MKKYFLQIFLLCSVCNISKQSDNILLNNIKIWGPGLEPHKLVLPARYFFIQTLKNNFRLNDSLDQYEFKVSGLTLDKKRACRIWNNVLNRKDGSFIVRYKLYEPCNTLEINIKYKDEHVGDSPFIINEVVYPEKCKCPKENFDEWLDYAKCKNIPEQINRDLSNFKEINWDEIRQKVIEKYDNPGAISICHYVIKNNEIYRKCYGKYVGFKMFMDNILLSLMRKLKFPDMEFFANLGDWPLVREKSELYPIFSWCGSTDTFDIIMPTYDLTESTIENMGRVMLDMLSVQGNSDVIWEQKIPKAFWRGRDSNMNRLKLVDISRDFPDLFNVSLTNFFFYRDQQEKYGPKAEHVSFYKFFDYKYQISIDGTVAAYRFPYLMAGGSLVFKVESKYYEHFYNDLIPDKHYIPIKTDLSDLVEKLRWAIEHDNEAKEIAENSRIFANDNLLPKDIYCYHAHLFNQFSKRISSNIYILDGMEKVEQPSESLLCGCLNVVKEEL